MEQMRRPRPLGETTSSNQPTYEDIQPSADWTQDSNCHVLLVDLPGFKKEELRVKVDNRRKVTVSGERQVNENKYSRFQQVFDAPQDSDIDKISGSFDGGLLFVIIPKKVLGTVEEDRESEIANEIEEEKMDELSNNKRTPKKDDEDKHNRGHNLHHEMKEEREREQEQEREREDEEKKEEKWRKDIKKKKEEEWRKEIEKKKEEFEYLRRRVMEKISKNRAIIVTAVLAFSVGLYLSQKLRSGGE